MDDNRNDVVEEIRSLFDAVCQGDLTPEQTERLERLLMTSEEAMGCYLELVHQHAALRLILGPTFRAEIEADPVSFDEWTAQPRQEVRPEDRRAEIGEKALEHIDARLPEESPSPISADSNMPCEPLPLSSAEKKGMFSLLQAAPITSFACAVGLMTVLLAAVWLWPREQLMGFGKVQIDAGTVRMQLPNVGQLIVDGPADLELVTPMRLRLDRGCIRVRVTEPAGHGFKVVTEQGEVTDQGTEFGLRVSEKRGLGLVVFDGAVDLQVGPKPADAAHVERLVQGEGVTYAKNGSLGRIMSIITGRVPTFQQSDDVPAAGPRSVILDVADNLRSSETRKYYEIVPGGLREDALAYVDRIGHEWNGVTKAGMPRYLLGADYVKTFIEDRTQKKMEISVTLSCPARLFVFFDKRVLVPEWVRTAFRPTLDVIGLDLGPIPKPRGGVEMHARGKGPGASIEVEFAVWERIVEEPGVVTLGPNKSPTPNSAMYGIAAIALETHEPPPSHID
jgi:hypothetical protein